MKDVSFVAPQNNAEQTLTYKIVGDHECTMLYYPPTQPVFDRAPVYVIIPGGGWHRAVAIDMANFSMRSSTALRARGWAVVSLSYRVAPVDGVKMQDIVSDCMDACRYLARFADVLGIDPHRIVTSGHSAGGHLAASTAVGALEHNGDTSHRATLRPDFAVLFYPVITGEPLHAHKGSFDYLLGADRTAELTARYSAEKLVSASTPPTFLVCSDDDGGVPPANSTMFYNALKAHGVPASLHILPSGGHGWGFRDSFRYKPQWQSALLDWLTAEK